MKKLITIGSMLMIAVCMFNIALVTAEVETFSFKDIQNDTVSKTHTVFYFPDSDDEVSNGNDYEFYMVYSMYPRRWNNALTQDVEFCNLTARETEYVILANGTTNNIVTVYNEMRFPNQTDIQDKRIYFQLAEQDGATVTFNIECKFRGEKTFDIPADMFLVTPSWDCEPCQAYEYEVVLQELEKAERVTDSKDVIVGYISGFFDMNYEIILILYYVFLMLIGFLAITLLFTGIIWLYAYLKRQTA